MKHRGKAQQGIPARLYRYFERAEHAQRLVDGHVWLSTLEYVRKCDASRADPHDATMRYQVSRLDADTPKAEASLILDRLRADRFFDGDPSGIRAQNLTLVSVVPDSFLLCLSSLKMDKRLQRVFGKYCVEIENPVALWREINTAVLQVMPKAFPRFDAVTYTGRSYRDADPQPGMLGFASDPSLAFEREFRMIWYPSEPGLKLSPKEVEVPRARKLCRRLN